jgi:solute:Na+ symporter, SSS family
MGIVHLSGLDIAIIVVYLVGITALGLWASRGIRTSQDFFLAGRSLPWWVAGASLVVSDIGAKDMVGLAGDAYRYGIVMMNFDFVACTMPVLVAAFLFMPLFWGSGVSTIPEFLGRRYNIGVRTFFAVVWSFFMVGVVATIFVSAAAMFEVLLGWPFWLSVGITSVGVAIFTTSGGLKAVAITDVASCIVLIGGAALLCFIGLREVGGVTPMIERVSALPWTRDHLTLLPPADHEAFPWPAVILGLGLVLGPAYWVGNQAIVQRTFGVRSQADARASYVFAAVIKLVFPVLLVLPGLLALALYADELGAPVEGWDANQVLPLMIARLVPSGALGLLMGAFIAGVMANLDSYVNSASTMLVTDLYRPFVRALMRPLRIIAFGAHPDDAELKAAGVAALWASQGHKVKFVSMTNGDVGHFSQAGGPLAQRRTAEVQECARILGIETQVLDIHDGELMPTLENRKLVARLIRDWQADIVMGHRPYDYHADHRYTGVLLDDAAVVVVAPFFVPDTKPTPRNPLFFYYSDGFRDPTPFVPTMVVDIDAVVDKKWQCISAMPSQFGDKRLVAGAHAARRARQRDRAAGVPAEARAAADGRRGRPVPRSARGAVRRGARPEGALRRGVPAGAVRAAGEHRRAEAAVPDGTVSQCGMRNAECGTVQSSERRMRK